MKYGILGAGAIGGYVGGRLLQSKANVVLIGRGALADAVNQEGALWLQRPFGTPEKVEAKMTADLAALSEVDAVMVVVRSVDTEQVAHQLKGILSPKAVVISLQNGVSNPSILASVLGEERVAAGMVAFNVVVEGARFTQTIEGPIAVGRSKLAPHISDEIASDLRAAGIYAQSRDEMLSVSWGKLLLNLGNSIGALTDLPILAFLSDADGRAVFAAAMEEGLSLLSAAGITPAKAGLLDPRFIARLLRAPIPKWLAPPMLAKMYKLTPEARSSTWRDVSQGRATEIDFLNGEFVRLAEKLGREAPVNQTLVRLVKEAEVAKASPRLSPKELRQLAAPI